MKTTVSILLLILFTAKVYAQEKKLIATARYNYKSNGLTPYIDSTAYFYDKYGRKISDVNYLLYKNGKPIIMEISGMNVYLPDQNNSYYTYRYNKNKSWEPILKTIISKENLHKTITEVYYWSIYNEWRKTSFTVTDTAFSGKKIIMSDKHFCFSLSDNDLKSCGGTLNKYVYDNFGRQLLLEIYQRDSSERWVFLGAYVNEFTDGNDSAVRSYSIDKNRDTTTTSIKIYRIGLLVYGYYPTYIYGYPEIKFQKDSIIYNSESVKTQAFSYFYTAPDELAFYTKDTFYINQGKPDKKISISYSYNPNQELTGYKKIIDLTYAGPDKFYCTYTYKYTANGKIISYTRDTSATKNHKAVFEVINVDSSGAQSFQSRREYIYDSLGRFVSLKKYDGAPNGNGWYLIQKTENIYSEKNGKITSATNTYRRNISDSTQWSLEGTYQVKDGSLLIEKGTYTDNNDTIEFTRYYYAQPELTFRYADSAFSFLLSPNPGIGKTTACIYSIEYDEIEFLMADIYGRVVYNTKFTVPPGPSKIPLILDGQLQNGSYVYIVKRRNSQQVLKGKYIIIKP